jgi:hypothetical protein
MSKNTKLQLATIAQISVNDVTIEVGVHANLIGYIREVCSYAANYKKDGVKFSWVVDGKQKTFEVAAGKFSEVKQSTIEGKKRVKNSSELQDVTELDKLSLITFVPSGFAANYIYSICTGFDYSNLRFTKDSKLMQTLKSLPTPASIVWHFTKLTNLNKKVIQLAKIEDKLIDANCNIIAATKVVNQQLKVKRAAYIALTTPHQISEATVRNEETRTNRTNRTKETV